MNYKNQFKEWLQGDLDVRTLYTVITNLELQPNILFNKRAKEQTEFEFNYQDWVSGKIQSKGLYKLVEDKQLSFADYDKIQKSQAKAFLLNASL